MPSRLDRVFDWAERHPAQVLALLFLFSLLVRFVTAEYLMDGDNASKWVEARRLAAGLGISHWYNHSMRWAVILPLAGLIKLFGPHPLLVYVLPFTLASVASVCICLIGEKIHSLKLGIAASLLTTLLPLMVVTGSQIFPGVFELGFTAIMVWLVMVWIDRRSSWLLVLAGVCFFLGWGARVTELYTYPGIVLLIWLPTRDFKAVVLFTAVAAGLCFAEWGWFWWDSGNPLGRLGLLGATRGGHPDLPISLRDYLLQFVELKKLKGLLPIAVLTLAASVAALRDRDMRVRGLGALYLGCMFLVLYMISGVSPLKLALPYGARYYPQMAPYGLLLLLYFLFKLKDRHRRTGIALIAVLFISFAGFSIKRIPPTNSLVQMSRDYALLKPVLAADRPIVLVNEPWEPNFIEKVLIKTFTNPARKKPRGDDSIRLDMSRDQERMGALFLDDISRYAQFINVPLVRVEKYRYILPSSDGGIESPAAESVFGRKLHRAFPLPAKGGS
ncbi:hypothetical protein [Pseudodesulfovibrio karagichevae]|uniref:Glycosyltransferase RgtA/B/C/D-like domain-containing protein n=1 Tax=Pseudodesulfovibrio karagichevae TaxID=3239305 RepID=A0ABV4K460_9BACT